MTYEDLFHFIADIQPSLPKCALPVLMNLISLAIKEASQTIAISDGTLAEKANVSRDSVRVAARALSHIIPTDGGKGTARKWTLPAHWFMQQRALFASPEISTDSLNLPGYQAGGRRVTRQPWTSFQAGSCLETRQLPDELPGRLGDETAKGCLETRQVMPGNQAGANAESTTYGQSRDIRSDQSVFFKRENTDRFNQIVSADLLKFEDLEKAAELKEALRSYMRDLGRVDPDQMDFGNIILARCLAIAPLDQLHLLLRSMRAKGTVPGKSFAWFVTVFAHRLCKIPAKTLQAGFDQQRFRKQAQREMEANFGPQLLQQVLPNVRQMRTKVGS